MTIYSIDNLTLREIKALRKSLDSIPITGIDAAFIAMLQHKTSRWCESRVKRDNHSPCNPISDGTEEK